MDKADLRRLLQRRVFSTEKAPEQAVDERPIGPAARNFHLTPELQQALGETLIAHGLISAEDLAVAVSMSRAEHLSLDRVLLNLDFIKAEELARALARAENIPFLRLNGRKAGIKPGLANSIISFGDREQLLVPVAAEEDTITIAMNRPLPSAEHARLERLLRHRVLMALATEAEIRTAQQRFSLVPGQSPEEERLTTVADEGAGLVPDSDYPDVDAEAQRVTEKDSALVKLVNRIIIDACESGASDVHIEPYPGREPITVRTRIDGRCAVYETLPSKYKYAIPSRIKIMANLDISERRRPQDGKIDFKRFAPLDLELRVATMPTVCGLEDIVIRLLKSGKPLQIDQLGLTAANLVGFRAAVNQPYGLILVVGPTGSGKTTTLHSAIAGINRPEIKIWTAEDPVEITQDGLRQVQINSRIGLTFAAAIRSFLRLDPDVIMIGEMRDAETAATAIEASLTGHLVFSTLHTNNAPETVTRLLDIGLDPFSFSDSILCILAQRLARKLCPGCRAERLPSDAERELLISEYGRDAFVTSGIDPTSIRIFYGSGCDNCQQTGYKGRIGIHELLVCDDRIRHLIKKRAETGAIAEQARAAGMTTLKQDGILKALQGQTDLLEVRRICAR